VRKIAYITNNGKISYLEIIRSRENDWMRINKEKKENIFMVNNLEMNCMKKEKNNFS
jgi:hypothetical protein